MKKVKNFIRSIIAASTLFPLISFAFFCPTNFQLINFGDTIDQVTSLCGKPDSQKESTKKEDHAPQQWDYFIPTNPVGTTTPAQGTAKTSLNFDQEGKLVNISSNNSPTGTSVSSNNMCGGINLGMTIDEVKSKCGDPAFTTRSTGSNTPPHVEIKVVEYVYNSNPPVTLVFENGVLKSKK